MQNLDKLHLELEQAHKENEDLRRENERLKNKLDYYMNRNNQLWIAASQIEGGLEAFRILKPKAEQNNSFESNG